MPIAWFPKHMAAAKKAMQQTLPRIDVLLELLDARLPLSSANPLLAALRGDKPAVVILNKADLADPALTARWQTWLERQHRVRAVPLVASERSAVKRVLAQARKLAPGRGDPIKPLRLMVVGIPNVGKSTFLNTLIGRRMQAVGDEPGITKGQRSVEIEPGVAIFDTPGVLWPKLDDGEQALRLAVSGAVSDSVTDDVHLAHHLGRLLIARYSTLLLRRYGLDALPADEDALLAAIGRRRGGLQAGGVVDHDKAAKILLKDFRSGALGTITLEEPPPAA